MVVSLAGRLTRKHVCTRELQMNLASFLCMFMLLLYCAQQYWKSKIEKFGGEVNNSITGNVRCNFLMKFTSLVV